MGWYIGNNGRTVGSGRSLYRVTRLSAEEIAEGVRDMQLSYLQNGNANYVDATAVTDWTSIAAVRVDLTVESDEDRIGTSASSPRLTRTVSYTANLRNLQP